MSYGCCSQCYGATVSTEILREYKEKSPLKPEHRGKVRDFSGIYFNYGSIDKEDGQAVEAAQLTDYGKSELKRREGTNLVKKILSVFAGIGWV